jgi:hypothetical protein
MIDIKFYCDNMGSVRSYIMAREQFYIRYSLTETFTKVSFEVFKEFRKKFLSEVTFTKASRLNLLAKYAKIA